MTAVVAYKLLALLATIALGWWVQRKGLLRRKGNVGTDLKNSDLKNGDQRGSDRGPDPGPDSSAVDVLGQAVLYLFIPALLFRTMARQDLSALPLRTLAAYFLPALLFALAVYAWQRWGRSQSGAVPATRAMAAVYGNSVQLGIPLVTALFGEPGLALHIALVSLHSLVLLSTLTMAAETDLARRGASAPFWPTLGSALRNTLIHPLLLPVLAGLAWNLLGLGLHPVVDQLLQTISQPAVPLSLLLIGMSLAVSGVRGRWQATRSAVALKLLVLPLLVLVSARFVFGLQGMPLGVLVMMAALPVGTNALVFAQRYNTLQGEASVTIVVSTLAFVATAGLWLAVLGALN